QNLFGMPLPASRPKTRATASSQDQAVMVFLGHVVLFEGITVDETQRTAPARFRGEVNYNIDQVWNRHRGVRKVVRAGLIRPVNDKRLADDIGARNEAPVT